MLNCAEYLLNSPFRLQITVILVLKCLLHLQDKALKCVCESQKVSDGARALLQRLCVVNHWTCWFAYFMVPS